MSYYEILLFVHIAAATIWLGAAFTFFLLFLRTERTGDNSGGAYLADANEWLAFRMFVPASLTVLVVGILLVLEGPWAFGDLWVLIGLVGYAFSFVAGIAVIAPTSAKIKAALAEHGPGPHTAPLVRRIAIVTRIELGVLFVVLADMALKPATDDAATLALFAVVVAVVAFVTVRTAPPVTAPQPS